MRERIVWLAGLLAVPSAGAHASLEDSAIEYTEEASLASCGPVETRLNNELRSVAAETVVAAIDSPQLRSRVSVDRGVRCEKAIVFAVTAFSTGGTITVWFVEFDTPRSRPRLLRPE
jgi:hypothetical protein